MFSYRKMLKGSFFPRDGLKLERRIRKDQNCLAEESWGGTSAKNLEKDLRKKWERGNERARTSLGVAYTQPRENSGDFRKRGRKTKLHSERGTLIHYVLALRAAELRQQEQPKRGRKIGKKLDRDNESDDWRQRRQ